MSIKVEKFKDQETSCSELAKEVFRKISELERPIKLIMPEGADGTVFKRTLSLIIDSSDVNLSGVTFIQGEGVWPLSPDDPLSFRKNNRQIKEAVLRASGNFVEINEQAESISKIDSAVKSALTRRIDIFVAGLNDSGKFLGLDISNINARADVLIQALEPEKWKRYASKVENYAFSHPNYFISVGAGAALEAGSFYFLTSGENKNLAVKSIVQNDLQTAASVFCDMRDKVGKDVHLYCDQVAIN